MEWNAAILLIAVSLPPIQGSLAASPLCPAERFRESYLRTMRESARRTQPDPFEVVPRLLTLLEDVDRVEGVASAERARMQRVLQVRLVEMQDRLARDLRRSSRGRGPRSGASPSSFAGPADQAQARRLIDLIQKTVAPESWEVNGGRGTISYYSPQQVLVVRQTGEVHHALGGILEQLRR